MMSSSCSHKMSRVQYPSLFFPWCRKRVTGGSTPAFRDVLFLRRNDLARFPVRQSGSEAAADFVLRHAHQYSDREK